MLPAALKFFRSCVNLQDEFYNRQITQNRLFEPILNIVYETMPRDNLLNSACLELFEFIKRENIKPIIIHIVENYRERLQQITYVDTFQSLLLRYDQMQGFNPDIDATLFSSEGGITPGHAKINGNHRWQGVKEMDATEEAYFNTSDDEDEILSKKKPLNGSTSLLKSLVDYPDDDEDAMDTKPSARDPLSSSSPQSLKSEATSPSTPTSTSTSPSTAKHSPAIPQTPPERLSEKRRREEDDEEDELGKLSITKRRSSSLSSTTSPHSNFSPNSNNVLKRKKGFTTSVGNRDLPNNSGKKIEISLAVKSSGDGGGEKG